MTARRRHAWLEVKRRAHFWLIAVLLCLLAAMASLTIQWLFNSVGSSRHLRYEPVDVPPPEVSPRHERERVEIERHERAVTDRTQSPSSK